MKKIISVPAAALLIILATSAWYFYQNSQSTYPGPIVNEENKEQPKGGEKNAVILGIEEELKAALRISAGINQARYTEIDSELRALENEGEDTKTARELLAKFEVGDAKSSTTNTPQPSPTVTQKKSAAPSPTPSPIGKTTAPSAPSMVTWDNKYERWAPSGTPPACPSLVFESPVDLSKATSILYPGQIRGGSINDYKAHGGFRFDNSYGQNIEVRSPIGGYVWRGARFLLNGEIQYGFDIVNECGIMQRFGHLYELSPKFQELADKMRPAVEGDSRTTDLEPFVRVSAGELIATKIGVPGNAGMDWGVYDLRKENSAASDPTFRELHKFQWYYDYHGLCWLDLLKTEQQTFAKGLPAGDGKMGKTSDYCK